MFKDCLTMNRCPASKIHMVMLLRQLDGITIVDVSGRLDSLASGPVMDRLNQIVNAGANRLIVNLKHVT